MTAPVRTVDDWAGAIRPHLHQAVDSIIETGRLLNEAKASLGYGDFGPLLADLGLSPQMAQRFMRVARHPVLANASPVKGLPPAVSVLDALTRMDPDDLAGAIERGEITASTTRSEAERIASATPMTRDEAERIAIEIRSKQLFLASAFHEWYSKLVDAEHPDPMGVIRADMEKHGLVVAGVDFTDTIITLVSAMECGLALDPSRDWDEQVVALLEGVTL